MPVLKRVLTRLAIGVVFLADIVAASSCRRPNTAKVALDLDVDASLNNESRLLAYRTTLFDFQSRFDESASVTVHVFGHDVEPVYGGAPLYDEGEFNAKVAHHFYHPDALVAQSGTRIERLLTVVADEVSTATTPIIVIIATDGGVEDRSAPVMTVLKAQLARLRQSDKLVKLVVIGVEPQARQQWQAWLRDLGDRAVVSGLTDYDQTLGQLGEQYGG